MTLDDNLTEEELAKLAKDGSNEEKSAVAVHPNASLQTLLFLANQGWAEDVEQNPLLPLYLEIGSDEVVSILATIAEQTQRGERLEELASSIWDEVRCSVAENESTPPATLSLLAKDKEEGVRHCVAWNSSTPPDTLSFLAKDLDEDVRRGVGRNENTPQATLSILAKDKQWSIRDAARTTLNKLEDDKR